MIGIPKQHYSVEFMFPVIVILCSCLNIYNQFSSNDISYISLLVSLIGIAGGSLYFGMDKFFSPLIWVWSVAQVLIIEGYTLDPYSKDTILNLTQGVQFPLGIDFSGTNGGAWIGVNLVAIVLLGLSKLLRLSLLFGKEISLIPFRENSSLNEFLPTTGIIEDRITLSKEKNWLLVKLNGKEPLSNSLPFALIKPKDNSNLKLKTQQIVYFLPVTDINMIKEENSRDDFVNGDWAIVN